jgi:F-type H+-transporting ATPase subunit b
VIGYLLADWHFWVLVAVVIFTALVWKAASRVILAMLDQRSARIRSELEEARKLRDEAEQLVAEYRQKERDATATAQAIIAQARETAERLAEQAARDLDQAMSRRQRLAEERIAQAENRALDEIRLVAVDTAIAAAREVIASGIDERRGGALIDSAIAALPQRLR